MPTKILMGFATRYGSTQEVAETIATDLRSQGFAVDVMPAKAVHSLDGYQAVVLGAPLYMFHWHKDVLTLLNRNRKILEKLPVAVFALGPFHNKEEELKSAREQLDKELAKLPWLRPLAVETFVGKFDPDKLGFPFNLIGPMKQMPPSDERDWPAIHDWANHLAEMLQQ